MVSEEFRVSISGPLISAFLYDAVNRPTDFEGLLFGDYQQSLHREISDQVDAGDQNRPATIIHNVHIRRIVPTGARFSFYDRRFNSNMPDYMANVVKEMNAVGKVEPTPSRNRPASSTNQNDTGPQEPMVRSGFLGWFRYQKVPPRFLQSELAICRGLSTPSALTGFPVLKADVGGGNFEPSAYFPWSGNGPLYLFAHPGNKNNILEWGMRLMAFNPLSNQLRNVRLNIRNLGDTTHADYWKIGDGGGSAAAGVDRLLPGIVPQDFSKQLVEETDRMAENAKRQLMAAVNQAVDAATRTFQNFRNSQKPLPPSYYYIRYGYSPHSSQDITNLVGRLESYVGAKNRGDFRPEMEIDSPHSYDNGHVSTEKAGSSASENSGDIGKDWHVVDDAETAAASASIVEKTNKIQISSNDTDYPGPPQPSGFEHVTTRGSKRPKNNTSSSSSGANSDEMPEPATGSVKTGTGSTQNAKAQLTVSSTANAGIQGNTAASDREKTGNQQQRKKSKSSDSGSSEGQDTSAPSPNAAHLGPLIGPQQMIRPSTPGSGRGAQLSSIPGPGKGRGQRYAQNLAAPPGFPEKTDKP